MHDTSALWKQILSEPEHRKEVKVTINGNEYGENRIVGVSVSGGLFDAPGVGNAVARTLELNIMPLEAPFGLIPPMSEIRCFVRLVSADGQRVSEYIQKGVFYADTVTRDSDTGMASVTAFDAIMRMDQLFGKTACTVTYDDGFGNIQKFECDIGDAMPIPETPSNPERLFLGWTPAPESVVLHDALYVAQWDSRRVITSGVSSSYNFRYWLFDNNEGIIEALRAGPVGGYGNPRIYAKTLNPLNWDGRGQQSAIAYRRSEGEKQARKGSAPRVAVTQAQRKFPGMTSEMRSHHNEILNHSPKSPA